jgi:PST family polysaccharide transporter
MDRRETARAFGWSVVFAALNRVILPLGTVLFSRLLGPEKMGVYYIAFNVMIVAEVFRDGGLSQTYISEQDLDRKKGTYHFLGICSGLVPALLLLLMIPWLAPALNLPAGTEWTLGVVAGVLAVNGWLTIPSAQLQRENRFKELGLAEGIASVACYLIAFVAVFLGAGLYALIGMLLARNLVNVFLVARYAPWPKAAWDRSLAREILGRSKSVLASMAMAIPFGMMDTLLVAKRLGPEASGYYGNARSLSIKPAELVSFPLGRALYVAYSKKVGDTAQYADVFVRSLTVAALFVLPIYLFLAAFSREIILVLLGDAWLPTVPLFSILCLYFGVRSIGTLGGSALTAAGKAALTVPCWLAAYALVIVLSWVYWDRLDTVTVAWIFFAGASTVYGSMTLTAMFQFRGTREALGRFGLALALGAVQFLLLEGILRSKIPPGVAVLGALLGLPLVHFSLVGVLFERNPRAFLSIGGLKKLYRTL